MKKKFLGILITIGIIAGSLSSIILFPSNVMAATIIVAASNSNSTWKTNATNSGGAICSGTTDEATINTYLTAGATVELAPGTYNITDTTGSDLGIYFQYNNIRLYGQGNTTILNLSSSGLFAWNCSNIQIDHMEITGTVGAANGAAVAWVANVNETGFTCTNIECMATGGANQVADYWIFPDASGVNLSNILFSQDDASNPDGFGFFNDAAVAAVSPQITNITYYNCTVENAGVASSRSSIWTTGFDFAESPASLIVNGCYVINCSVNGAWESDFHMENTPTLQNFIITGCSATNAGEKPSPTYGYGYLTGTTSGETGDVVYNGNTASVNAGGDLMLDGTVHTPIVNGISPIGSSKTASAISVGNCAGVVVNEGAGIYEIVAYTNNASPVNQNITVAGNIVNLNFTNYLVESYNSNPTNVSTVNTVIVCYTYHDDSSTNSIKTSILAATPNILIDNTSHSLWGINGGYGGNNNCIPSYYTSIGIQVFGYIDANYETNSGESSITANESRISGIATDGATGVFIDQVTNTGLTSAQKIYLSTLYAYAQSFGLKFMINTGLSSFDYATLSADSDYIMDNEAYAGASITASETGYNTAKGYAGIVVMNNSCATSANALTYTEAAWNTGIRWAGMTSYADYGSSEATYCTYISTYIAGLKSYSAVASLGSVYTSGVGSTNATISGSVSSVGGQNPTVSICYGIADGGLTLSSPTNGWATISIPTSPSQPQGAVSFTLNATGLSPSTTYYYNATAVNKGGQSWVSSSGSFTTTSAASTSTITISSATSVMSSSATLNGNITATGGNNPSVTFYWGTSNGGNNAGSWANNSVPTIPSQPQGIASFSLNLLGLNTGTTYYFNASATNSAGTSWAGASLNFTTGSAPTISLSPATNITSSTASISGIFSNTVSTSVSTMYWGTSNGGSNPANWANSYSISGTIIGGVWGRNITGLSTSTLYYYTASSSNTYGTTWATPQTFTTSGAPSVATITINAASGIGNYTATLSGNITATGGSNPSVTIYWGIADGGQVPASWANSVVPTSPSQPQGVASFTYNVSGLTANTLYYFSASAVNTSGTAWPVATKNFTTSALSIGNVSNLFANIGVAGANTDTSMTLTWQLASNATYTVIQEKTGGYPVSPTDGTTVYVGTNVVFVQTGLVAGTTYYYSAWGYNGSSYSGTPAHFMMTTAASNGSTSVMPNPSDNMNPPAPSSGSWFTNMQPFSGFIQGFEDSWGMQTDMMQYTIGILILLLVGFFLYIKTKSPLMPFLAGIVVDVGLIMLKLMPTYSIGIIIAFALGVWALENIWI